MMKLSLLGSGLLLTALLLNGCGPSAAPDKAGESVFRYGTTAYGVAMENAGMDPHDRLARAAEGFQAPAIRFVYAFEHLGRGREHNGVDLAEVGVGIGERGADGLEHELRAADIGPRRAKLGLAEP